MDFLNLCITHPERAQTVGPTWNSRQALISCRGATQWVFEGRDITSNVGKKLGRIDEGQPLVFLDPTAERIFVSFSNESIDAHVDAVDAIFIRSDSARNPHRPGSHCLLHSGHTNSDQLLPFGVDMDSARNRLRGRA